MKLIRNKEQEEKPVKFWAESSNGDLMASLVYNNKIPDEMEIRVSTPEKRFSIPGHKSVMEKMTFEEFESKVVTHLERL